MSLQVYKSELFPSLEVLNGVLEKAKKDIENHRTSVGVPAPIIHPQIKEILVAGDFTFVEKTEAEIAQEKMEAEMKAQQEAAAAERLAAQQAPSDKYSVFRAEEYPALGDQLDAIIKTFAALKTAGVAIGEDGEKLLSDIQAIKEKYPKPTA